MSEELNQPVEQPVQEAKSERDYNFKMMRERAEAAERRAADIEAQYAARHQKHVGISENNDDDGDLVEKRYVRKLERELEKTREERQADKAALSERLLRQAYRDFDDVVSTENIEKLARKKPATYRSIQSNPDLFDKGEAAYDAIKTFLVENKTADADRKIENNNQRPASSSSMKPVAAESPLANMDAYKISGDGRRTLSPERIKELQDKMARSKPYSMQ